MPRDSLARLRGWGRAELDKAGIETAGLDARLLLQHATGLSHETLIAEPERLVEADRFRALIARRRAREPVSRIKGGREFYGRSFILGPQTLDPRPDTETLIEAALACAPRAPRLIDLGTGTGCILVTLLCELPEASGLGTDISEPALAIAKFNACRHGVADRACFMTANWFEGVAGRFDLILSNPPYIPTGEINGLMADVRRYDPRATLDGGCDGLEAYRALAEGAGTHLDASGQIIVEIGIGQEAEVTAIFRRAGWHLHHRRRDLSGKTRCLTFCSGKDIEARP